MLCQIGKMTCGGRRKDESPHSHWLKIESGHVSIPASEGFWAGGGEHFSTQGLSAAAARCCGDGSKLEQPTPNPRHIATISQITAHRFIMRRICQTFMLFHPQNYHQLVLPVGRGDSQLGVWIFLIFLQLPFHKSTRQQIVDLRIKHFLEFEFVAFEHIAIANDA